MALRNAFYIVVLAALPWPKAAAQLLLVTFALITISPFLSGSGDGDSSSFSGGRTRTHLARLYLIYVLSLLVSSLFDIASGIVWPFYLRRRAALSDTRVRRRWCRTALIIEVVLLPFFVVFGACATAYAAHGWYDDAQNGWIEGVAPLFAVLCVAQGVKIVASYSIYRHGQRGEDGGELAPIQSKEGV